MAPLRRATLAAAPSTTDAALATSLLRSYLRHPNPVSEQQEHPPAVLPLARREPVLAGFRSRPANAANGRQAGRIEVDGRVLFQRSLGHVLGPELTGTLLREYAVEAVDSAKPRHGAETAQR